MGIIDSAKNKAQRAAGKLREKLGDITGSPELRADGQTEQAMARLKQTGAKIQKRRQRQHIRLPEM